MFTEGAKIYDNRYDRYGVIDSIESHSKGLLHRVHFENGKWGSYYTKSMDQRFTLVEASAAETEVLNEICDDNVVFLDLRNRSKFVDRCSWLSWLNMR